MGNTVGGAVEKLKHQQNKSEEEVKRELKALTVILDAKEAEFRQQLIMENSANKELPIDKIIKLVTKKVCDVSTAPSEKLTGMIESLFGGSFLAALKGLIMGALDTVLGNASAGEKQTKGFTVMLLHGAVVRVDYYVYSYTFRSDGVSTKLQNGLVFAISMATVKLASVNSEVIALLSGLTAEGSIGYMKLHNANMKKIRNRAKQKIGNYSTEEANQKILTLFGDDDKPMADPADAAAEHLCPRDMLTKIIEDTEPPVAPESGEKPSDAQVKAKAEARKTRVNALLAAAAIGCEIEESELDQVFEEQKKVLDKMKEIYAKIADMKRSTGKSIAYAKNRIASNPGATPTASE